MFHCLRYLDSLYGTTWLDIYDQWSFFTPSQYQHLKSPDGNIDNLVVIYRTSTSPSGASGNPDGKVGVFEDGSPIILANSHVRVRQGDGVRCFAGRDYPKHLLWTIEHELGHRLLGATYLHQYDGGVWSLMGHRNASVSPMMNSWERWQLGWLDDLRIWHVDAGDSIPLVHIDSLRDYAQWREAVVITDTSNREADAFWLEYHRQNYTSAISQLPDTFMNYIPDQDAMTYDMVDRTMQGQGLYILHFRVTSFGEGTTLRVVPSDGRWQWEDLGTYTTSCCGEQHLWKRLFAYRNTYDWRPQATTRDTSPVNDGVSPRERMQWLVPVDSTTMVVDEFIWAHIDPRTLSAVDLSPYSLLHGNQYDGWNDIGANIFSPWSNPNTDRYNAGPLPCGVEITEMPAGGDTDKVYFRLYRGYDTVSHQPLIINARPSRPQNVRLTLDTMGATLVWRATWDAIIEPDVVNGGKYEVWYRATTTDQQSGTGWLLLDTLSSADTTTLVGQFGVGEGDTYYLEVRVRAADSTNDSTSLLSTFSEIVGGELFWVMPKRGENSVDRTPVRESAVKLFVQRDHTLNIIHDAPKGAFVKLAIVDMLGRQCLERPLSPGSGGVVVENLYLPFLPAGRYVVRIAIGENEFHDAAITLY